jgi:hypothetical protein
MNHAVFGANRNVMCLHACLMRAESQPAERCPGHVVLSAYCGDQRLAVTEV